jgi:hypothetical protein
MMAEKALVILMERIEGSYQEILVATQSASVSAFLECVES